MQQLSARKIFRSRFPYLFTLVVGCFIALMPTLGDLIADRYLSRNATQYVDEIVGWIRNGLTYPLSKWLKPVGWQQLVWIPWLLGIGFLIRVLHLLLRPLYRYLVVGIVAILLVLRIFPGLIMIGEPDAPSRSTGSVSNGKLENGKRIPFQGENYCTYSFWGYLTGRTFVHAKVRKTVLETYAACAESIPGRRFVLMETGPQNGGRFLPHKTHRSGMSVDFMTPQLKDGKPYENRHIFNLWGYRREFDDTGKLDEIEIDYEVMAQHLLHLHEAARKNGLRIKKVIFDPVLQPYLFQTPTGKQLKGKFYFTRGRVIVRHDDHYHVDFELR